MEFRGIKLGMIQINLTVKLAGIEISSDSDGLREGTAQLGASVAGSPLHGRVVG